MKKKDIKVLAIVAVILAIALVVIYLFTSYRGPDGLTFKEAQMLKKYGAAEISKEELEEVIDLDKYNETIAFYESDPSLGDRIKHFFGSGNGAPSNTGQKEPSKNNDKNDKDNSNSNGGNTGNSGNSGGSSSGGITEYEKYIAMSPEKQQAYFESFSDPEDFFKWYNKAKAEYDKANRPDQEGGSIDIGDYMD